MNQDQSFSVLATKMLWKREFKELKCQRVPFAALRMQLTLLAGGCVGVCVCGKHKRCSTRYLAGASKKTV